MLIATALICIVLVAADLLTKALICPAVVEAGGMLKFIPGVFRFEYTQNTGMAWGLFGNATLILTIFTVIACVVIIFFIIKTRASMPKLVRLGLALILSGAIGNLYDRIFLGYVRDFIVFDFWDTFPVFNFADSCVTVGAVILGIALILTKSGRKFFMSLDGEKEIKPGEGNESASAEIAGAEEVSAAEEAAPAAEVSGPGNEAAPAGAEGGDDD